MFFALPLHLPTPFSRICRGALSPWRPRPERAARLSPLASLLGLCAGLSLSAASQAAGGHHAVDDAAILEAGQCQLETWLESAPGRKLQHLGPACQVLGVELGGSLERSSLGAEPPQRSAALQLKWATEVRPGLSLGAIWSPGWELAPTRTASRLLLGLLSWAPHADWALHLNLGRDLHAEAKQARRYGAALEWQASAQMQFLAESWRDALGSQRRLGVRYSFAPQLTLDLSRAQASEPLRPAWWTLGLSWTFER